jgi:uncharacterized coiled-coil DUF342 family protein
MADEQVAAAENPKTITDQLRADYVKLTETLAPFYRARDELHGEIAPLESKLREVNQKIKLAQPKLAEFKRLLNIQ